MNASPDFALTYPNLLSASLGARPLSCSDEFFAPASRMLADSEPVFIPDKYDDHGKWMDGWESRRCRQPDKTHDWCVVRLAAVAAPKGVLIDTRHFTGNYPPHASLDGCHADEVDGATEWSPLLSKIPLQPDDKHYFPLTTDRAVSHLRLNIFSGRRRRAPAIVRGGDGGAAGERRRYGGGFLFALRRPDHRLERFAFRGALGHSQALSGGVHAGWLGNPPATDARVRLAFSEIGETRLHPTVGS